MAAAPAPTRPPSDQRDRGERTVGHRDAVPCQRAGGQGARGPSRRPRGAPALVGPPSRVGPCARGAPAPRLTSGAGNTRAARRRQAPVPEPARGGAGGCQSVAPWSGWRPAPGPDSGETSGWKRRVATWSSPAGHTVVCAWRWPFDGGGCRLVTRCVGSPVTINGRLSPPPYCAERSNRATVELRASSLIGASSRRPRPSPSRPSLEGALPGVLGLARAGPLLVLHSPLL